ncbi:MAG: MmgE/PrpD family protein, partial [Thermoleophilia bacterium]
MSTGESLRLARHVVGTGYEDLPEEARRAARRSLLDALGVMLAAATLEEACRPFAELAACWGGAPESTILGSGARVPAAAAAFANGALAHALDFEDAHDRARVHPYAATVAAALAVAQARGDVGGPELIAALALGSDLVCRLGLALTDDPVKRGWYMAPILGAFGATAAAGRLLGLSAPEMVNAFSLTLTQATGTAESTYSPTSVVRAVRDAFSAHAGVVSAQLAARGVVGFEHPFEGEAGLFRLYALGEHDLGTLVRRLGEDFEGANVSYKPWPCCRGTHAHIQVALEITAQNGIERGGIERVRLATDGSPVMRLLCEPLEAKRRPLTAIDGKFSLPFTVASAAVHGAVSLRAFTAAGLADPEVRRVADTVECDVAGGGGPGWVEIRTARGDFRADVPRQVYGSPGDPISQHDLVAKFRRCAGHSSPSIP